jgi:serine/threonine-protein kinase
MQVREQPTPPSEIKNDIPFGLEQIILGSIEKNPDRRFQSASQVLKYVERLKLNPDYIFKTRESSNIDTNDQSMKKKKAYSRRNHNPQSKSMFPIVLGVSVAFAIVLIIGAIIVLDKVLTQENANAPETVMVPDLYGINLNVDEITSLLDPAYFTYDIQYVHNQLPSGTVISQTPAGNSKKKVQKGMTYCHVKLKVSRGAELASVPDLTTMEYRKAKIYAEELGFVVKIVDDVSEIFGVGIVTKTIPAPREKVEFGSTITIYKSIGPEYTKVKAGNYVGISPSQAYTKINNDFKIGAVTYAYSDTIQSGLIMEQNLIPDTFYIKYTVINFVISLGPEPPKEPDVTEPENIGPGGDIEFQ